MVNPKPIYYECENNFVLHWNMFFVLFHAVLMGDLRSWVSDRLMSLLGYSQSTVVQYVVSICKSVMFFSHIHVCKWCTCLFLSGSWILEFRKSFIYASFVSAKNASSPAEIVNKLADVGLSPSSETQAFAQQIFARVERKSSGPNVSLCLSFSN